MTHVLTVAARIAKISTPIFNGDLPASVLPGSAKARCTSPVDSPDGIGLLAEVLSKDL